ncbi:MAG: hypothetical protein ACYDBB_14740 [Armatimonadota bacterium]
MMSVPSPAELVDQHGAQAPEHLAAALGFTVTRREDPPVLSGVTVFSEYNPEHTITLYTRTLRQWARDNGESLTRVEQWHIAHELYHGLAESRGDSPWRVRETDAGLWADELMAMVAGK